MPKLLRTIPRSKFAILAGTNAPSFFLREGDVFVEHDLDGAPTGHSFEPPSWSSRAVSPGGERMAFGARREVRVLERAGKQLRQCHIEACLDEGALMAFDRSGRTLAILTGAPNAPCLTMLDVESSRAASTRIDGAEHAWLLPDWSADGVMLLATYYDQSCMRADVYEAQRDALAVTWSCDFSEEHPDIEEPIPLHYDAGALVLLASEQLVVLRRDEEPEFSSAGGACMTFEAEASSPERLAIWGKDALRIYDAATLAQRASIDCKDDGGVRRVLFLAHGRLVILKDRRFKPFERKTYGDAPVAEVWSFAE